MHLLYYSITIFTGSETVAQSPLHLHEKKQTWKNSDALRVFGTMTKV